MVREQGALALEEIQEVGDLFEVRGHVGVVSAQMDIVELDIDDVLDPVPECAALGCPRWVDEQNGGRHCDGDKDDTPHVCPPCEPVLDRHDQAGETYPRIITDRGNLDYRMMNVGGSLPDQPAHELGKRSQALSDSRHRA